MRKFISRHPLAVGLLLPGLLCALLLCALRASLEADNSDVSIIMTREDAALLDGALPSVRLFDGEPVLDGALLLVEDKNQHSHRPYEELFSDFTLPAYSSRVRCFLVDGDYAARYRTLGYDGAQEIENMLYRAVTDRNIRVLWLKPFTDAQTGALITDAAVYEEVLSNLHDRIASHGLSIGDRFSVFPSFEPPAILLIGLILGICGAGWLVLTMVFPIRLRRTGNILLCLAALCASAAAVFLFPELSVPLAALAASVCFPCLAVLLSVLALRSLSESTQDGFRADIFAFLRILLPSFAVALVGGCFAAAALSPTDYLLAVSNFRGVKLSQALPLVFTLFVLLRFLSTPRELLAHKKTLLPAAFLVILALIYFLLRTGNAEVSVWELRFRAFLENTLIVRPRTKEFLIAWPVLSLAAAACIRGKRPLAVPFSCLSCVGFTSVVNTFCHARAPVWLSVTRSVLGLGIGVFLAFILLFLVHAALRMRKAEKD